MTSRVVVLTGASSGIGRAAAKAFAARGDRLVLAARGLADLTAVAASLPGDPLVVPADVTDPSSLSNLVDEALERFGRIDVWSDTAAVMAYGRFEDLPAEVFDRVVTTDLLGSANVARAALRQFRAQGHGTLILCGSLLGHVTVPYMSAYVTSKWGLRGLTRTLAQEVRDLPDVHVSSITPGSVDTPIYTSAANYAGFVGRPPPPVDPPSVMADAIVKNADHPRLERSVGATNRLFELGFVYLPWVYDRAVGPLARRMALSTPTSNTDGNVFESKPRFEGGPIRWGRLRVGAIVGGAAALGVAALVHKQRR